MAGFAQYDVQYLKPLRTDSKQIMKNWIENALSVFGGTEVRGLRNNHRQPDDRR